MSRKMDDAQDTENHYASDKHPPLEQKIESTDSDPPGDEPANNSDKHIFGMTRDRFVELVFAFAITIFTGGMWWTSSDQVAEMKVQSAAIKGQLDAMNAQLTEMKNGSADTKAIAQSAKTQAESTNKMAEAAIAQVKELKESVRTTREANSTTRQASMLDQRAWVGIKHFRMKTFEVNKPVEVEIILTNSGKTFARKVVLVAHKAIGRRDVVVSFDEMDKVLATKPEKPNVLFPNLEVGITTHTSFDLNETQHTEIRNRTHIFYIFGHISYVDVFDRGHVTEFCGMYDVTERDLHLCDQHQNAT